ncbi:MAG: outer membrane protein assembly factor BamA [Phycisphaeraceae bacterium]
MPIQPRLVLLLALWLLLQAGPAFAQGLEFQGRPIAEIRVEGLEDVPEQLVRNQIRLAPGDPLDQRVIEQDVVRITHLGRFSGVEAQVQPQPDNSVILIYALQEQPLLDDVQVVGNRLLTDRHLIDTIGLRGGDPVDPFLIDRGRRRILDAYQDRGFFLTEVDLDQDALDEQRILLYQVREGPRVRVRSIQFQGNDLFSDGQLLAQTESRTYVPVFRDGALSREQIELDAAAVRAFYEDRGYLDAQVGREVRLSPDQREAVVVFVIEEGERYIVDDVRIDGARQFPPEQIRRFMPLRSGDAYSQQAVRDAILAIENHYGQLGYMETRIEVDRLFHQHQPRIDVLVRITEGIPAIVGEVTVRGNERTQEKVILREVRGMRPGRPFERPGVRETQRRLRESPLFNDASITLLGEPNDPVRDVLIDVNEGQTGAINIGAGVSSDLGLVGAISLTQQNFDIAGVPDRPRDLFTGRAFRGAGQFFQINLQPGTQASRYGITFGEPSLLEHDVSLRSNVFYYDQRRFRYDEQRLGGSLSLGHSFGDVWSASVSARGQEIRIDDIDPEAPVDVFDVRGNSALTGLSLGIERNTTDSIFYPTEGSNLSASVERVGALGGDYRFTRLEAGYHQFWTVNEDFFGRRSVLSLRLRTGYIVEEDRAPVFERLYAGGHRTMRGFEYRGVGPRGIRADTGELGDEAVGGRWQLLGSAEYNFPLLGEPQRQPHMGALHGVFFTDVGTVRNSPALNDWRVSIGAGLRIQLPILGQAPFAIDFAVPIVRESGDQRQLISFDMALPLQ